MTLHLVQILPESKALVRYAKRAGLPLDDPGYLWHRAFRDAFGGMAPQPFRWLQPAGHRPAERGAPGRLLGYGPSDAGSLTEMLALAESDLARVFPEHALDSRIMPTGFARGQRLGFEIRVCPVVRTDSHDGKRKRELDAFVHHAAARPDEPKPAREEIYRDWLARQLEAGGAEIGRADMTAFTLEPLVRRRHASPNGRTPTRSEPARRLTSEGQRKAARRPDAVFRGTLAVTDPERFAASLAKGIGRHRAFGFGMLLLRPA
ncbi:MAG: type I-E CRISPR-associated protein Cas6/Cse3/CasE [Alphaproteobacteria bacterium]